MANEKWYKIGEVSKLKSEECHRIYAKTQYYNHADLVLICHDGGFSAMNSYCSHEGGDLTCGDIEDLGSQVVLMCPSHGQAFDIYTGKNVDNRTNHQAVAETKVEEGYVYIKYQYELSTKPFEV